MQELISDYAGTVLLVSHDRDFLDRTVTSVIVAEGDGRWIEYAGGYTDMVAQRGAGISGMATEAGSASPRKERSPGNQPAGGLPASPKSQRKLTFKDKHALETLPGKIDELTREAEQLQSELSDAGLFTRSPQRFADVTERLAVVEAERSAAEEEWLELEIKREELGN